MALVDFREALFLFCVYELFSCVVLFKKILHPRFEPFREQHIEEEGSRESALAMKWVESWVFVRESSVCVLKSSSARASPVLHSPLVGVTSDKYVASWSCFGRGTLYKEARYIEAQSRQGDGVLSDALLVTLLRRQIVKLSRDLCSGTAIDIVAVNAGHSYY